MGIQYPATRRDDLVEELHGRQVADPYRYLEDAKSEETQAWIKAQSELTAAYIAEIPERAAFKKRLTELMNHERCDIPIKKGGRYFWTRNDGLQNQSVVYVADGLDAEPRVLLDPNLLSEDGSSTLAFPCPSPDGRYFAYGVKQGGGEWETWRIRDVETGEDLADRIEWAFSHVVSWTADGAGFYYRRFELPEPGGSTPPAHVFHKVCYHRVGAPQSADQVVLEDRADKTRAYFEVLTEDGRYMIVYTSGGEPRTSTILYRDFADAAGSFVELISQATRTEGFIGNVGTRFFFWTERDAPLCKVVCFEVGDPDPSKWRTVVPEGAEALDGARLVGGKLLCRYMKDACSLVKVYGLDGVCEREVVLPGFGTAQGFEGSPDDPESFFLFTGFTFPPTIYRYDVASGQATVFRRARVDFNPEDFETEQVFYSSKDGTRVPMFITRRKGLPRDGSRRAKLTGYGGFTAISSPRFSAMEIAWLEQGWTLALACIRGGGEYGAEWHKQGTGRNKQNSFDDFMAAAEYLVAAGYTSSSRLVIAGASNGGLLMGACVVQRPELFAACLSWVGLYDMMRYHIMQPRAGYKSEYGCADDPEDFEFVLRYSPYQNVREGVSYPATLIATGLNDENVPPQHSFKFAAAMQHAQAGPAPIFLRTEQRAGHGWGKPTAMRIEEEADAFAFAWRNVAKAE